MKNKLVKSPFNYIGGKYKLLPQLLELFPNNISMFYDVFGGGANVALNVESEFVYYNDIVPYVGNVFDKVKGKTYEECIKEIKDIVEKYDLSKTNKEGFEKLREDYNNGNRVWSMFYVLTCYSFNYQYRFNNKHEYNSSFGKDRSSFNATMEVRFKHFIERLNNVDISFDNKDFRKVDLSDANENDLVYFDPPYLISCGNYNDGKRGFKGWNSSDDLCLMNLCDELDEQGTRFAMSNVFEHKGLKNEELINWSKKYRVHYLDKNYNNCNYQDKNKENKTIEVLITNY